MGFEGSGFFVLGFWVLLCLFYVLGDFVSVVVFVCFCFGFYSFDFFFFKASTLYLFLSPKGGGILQMHMKAFLGSCEELCCGGAQSPWAGAQPTTMLQQTIPKNQL